MEQEEGQQQRRRQQSFLDAFRARREALHTPSGARSKKEYQKNAPIQWHRFARLRIMVGGSCDTLGLRKTYYYASSASSSSASSSSSSVENDIPLIDGPCIRVSHAHRGKCIVLPELEREQHADGFVVMRTNRGCTRISTTTPDLSDAQVSWIAENSNRGARASSCVSVFVPIEAFSPLFEVVGSMWKAADSGGGPLHHPRTAVVAWRPASSHAARWPTLAGMVANGLPGVLQPLAQVGVTNACIPFYQSRECIVDIGVDFSSCDLSGVISAACFRAAVSASSMSILLATTRSKNHKRARKTGGGDGDGGSMSMLGLQRALMKRIREKKHHHDHGDDDSDSSCSSSSSSSSCDDFADDMDFWTSDKCKPIARPQKCVVGGVVDPSLMLAAAAAAATGNPEDLHGASFSAAANPGIGGAGGGGERSRKRRRKTCSVAQRKPTNRFGECYVVPSIDGNIYLRDFAQSTIVTFKGARNVEMVRETVDAVLKRKGSSSSSPSPPPAAEREDYRVYMAVASACIGRHVGVGGGYSVVSRTLQKVLRRMGGSAESIFQIEEENNAERLKVLGWSALWACANEIDASFRSPHWASGGCLDLSIGMVPPESWQNNISLTSKGCIITRLSWGDPIVWTEETSRMALNACNVLAYVIQHCC